MADIASLGIRVTTQGVAQANNDLARLSKEAGAAERASVKLGTSIGRYLGVGLTALVGAGIAGIISNTIAAEKAQAQLGAVLKSTGGAAGLTAGELNKMAAALQQVTVFDDEAITGAQSLLLTFTKIGRNVFPQATEAVLNMSQALGQDLKSSAVQLGKALNDPIKGVTALQRVGVAFTASQKDLIESMVEMGDVAGAQKLILKELETEFGNSARAARDTLGGALEGLKNDFGNLLEGDSGDAGIKGTTAAVNDLAETMRSPEVRAGFAEIVSGLAQVASFAAQAIASMAGFAVAVRDATSANSQKTEIGLLQRRFELEDRLARLKNGKAEPGINRSIFAASLIGIGPDIAEVDGELKKVQARLVEMRKEAQTADSVFSLDWIEGTDKGKQKTKKPKSGDGGKAKAAREAAAALRELEAEEKRLIETSRRAAEERDRAIEQFGEMAAQLSGPLQAAEFEHKQRLNDIEEAGRAAGKASEEIARVKELETQRYQEQRLEIEESLDPIGELIKEKQEELRLMGLSEAAYRTAIDLRGMESNAIAAQRDELIALNQAKIDAEKTTAAMDDFRESFTDAFASVLDGSKSAAEAFKDFADSIIKQIARIIAERAALALFGEPGTTQTGSAGGSIASLFASLFSGGRAIGGPVSGGRLYEVNERGAPEYFESGGRQYLLPGKDGKVTPATAGGGGGGNNVFNFNFTGQAPTRENAQYFANKARREVARAGRGG